jgi:hypothetical protein
MRIVIYDTQHYEMVNVWSNIFNHQENQLLYLVNDRIQKKLFANSSSYDNANKIHFVLKDDSNVKDFYKKCDEQTAIFKPDLVIMNTIDSEYKSVWKYLKKLNAPYCITIHNIHTWLKPPFTLNRKALSNYFFRKKMISHSSFIVVQEELFIDYIKLNKLYRKNVFAVPHTIREFETAATENSKIRVAIPGGIDGVRRDYNFTKEIIEEISKISSQFQFIFLGKVVGPIGIEVWKKIEELKLSGVDIEHHYDDNSNLIFDEQMRKSDIVFLPLNVDTKFEGIHEIYGTSKVTGVIYDMMRFSKPGIVPLKMKIPPTMKDSLISYESKKQLIDFFISLKNDKGYLLKLKKVAIDNSSYYNVENVRNRVLISIKESILK